MTDVLSAHFKEQAAEAIGNATIQESLDRLVNFRQGRVDAIAEYGQERWDALSQSAREIKRETLEHLDYYLDELSRNVERAGGHVFFARDAAEANEYVAKVAADNGVKTVIKSKSMVSEEMGIADVLEPMGIEPVETDLGEYIIQLAREAPYHIIAPALHKSKEEVSELFERILGTPADHGARRAGTRRFYSLSGMTIDDLILLELKVDRLALAELGERLGELTTGKEQLQISCDSVSVFRASIRDRVATPDTTTMPLGQTHVSPIEESVAGRLVFDGSAFPPESLGVLQDTISVEFSDGLSRVTGDGREAQVLASWRRRIDDPGIYRLNHISYGYHPNVPLPTGRLVADERVFGCLCVGFGPPQPYTCHSDLTILEATVHVDDEPIQIKGRYVDPEVRRLARSLGAPGY